MPELIVYRAKPNPVGKDKLGALSPNSQLNGEWVDIYNASGRDLRMAGITLYDNVYSPLYCTVAHKRAFFTFNENWVFPAGKVVRIHSGKEVPEAQLSPVDRNGADFHGYTNEGYVLNNRCGDRVEIVQTRSRNTIDFASYSANSPEGKVLIRQGAYLV